jgi:predicted house-cleaning noncanonical NTP pyrophosphatase (MazG superfamily)
MPPSSFQELMKLITENLENKSPEELDKILELLNSLLSGFGQDVDLLEQAIRKVHKRRNH